MKVRIKNLCVQTIAGAFDWERGSKRNIFLNITFEYGGSEAAKTDSLENALDYTNLEQNIITEVEGRSYTVIEALAKHVVDITMQFSQIAWVEVEVDKPGVLRQAESVSVTYRGER